MQNLKDRVKQAWVKCTRACFFLLRIVFKPSFFVMDEQ